MVETKHPPIRAITFGIARPRASYHRGPASLAAGLQGAGVVARRIGGGTPPPASVVREVWQALAQAAAR